VPHSAIVPRSTAKQLWGPPKDGADMLISIRVGAVQRIARGAPTAPRPDLPEYLRAVPPPDPKSLRTGAGRDLGRHASSPNHPVVPLV
jgi:putative ABC transport system permease protein